MTTKTKTKRLSLEIVDIDSMKAKQLLRKNEGNRKLSPGLVATYVADMQAGDWQLGNVIALDVDGKLIDGQHRLTAIIESDTVQKFGMWKGLPPVAADTIDTGRKRTFANMLERNGYAPETSKDIGAVVSWALRCQDGTLSTNRKAGANLTFKAMQHYLDENPLLVDALVYVRSLNITQRKGFSRTMLAGLYYCALMNGLGAEAEDFLTKYATGTDLQPNTAALKFRELAIKHDGASKQGSHAWCNGILIKAFNKHVLGEPVFLLKFDYDGNGHRGLKSPEAFPALISSDDLV